MHLGHSTISAQNPANTMRVRMMRMVMSFTTRDALSLKSRCSPSRCSNPRAVIPALYLLLAFIFITYVVGSKGTPGRKRIRKHLWIPKRLGPGRPNQKGQGNGQYCRNGSYERSSKEAAQMNTKVNRPTACHNRITRLI
jgi:hypothetical protein